MYNMEKSMVTIWGGTADTTQTARLLKKSVIWFLGENGQIHTASHHPMHGLRIVDY